MGAVQVVAASSGSASGSPPSPSSGSSGSAPYAPYKAAVRTDTVAYQTCQQITVAGDFNGRPVRLMVDPGAAFSCVGLEWLKQNHHVLFYPGSSAELCHLSEPRSLSGFVPANPVRIEYAVRNAPLGLGDGVFPVTFQVVPGAAFDLTLGLDFLWGYAVRFVARDPLSWGQGAQLMVPVPQQYRRRGEPRPPPKWWQEKHGDTPYVPYCSVRARYEVRTDRIQATVLNPSCLDSL
jgi:hypothetical protein